MNNDIACTLRRATSELWSEVHQSFSTVGERVSDKIGNIAQLEQKILAERVKLGVRTRWEQGKWKGDVPPYGYDYNLETDRLEMNEKEARPRSLRVRVVACLGTGLVAVDSGSPPNALYILTPI